MPAQLSAYEHLTSAETLVKLLKLSATQNLALRYIVYDLCALILSSVNAALHRVRQPEETSADGIDVRSPLPPQISAAEYYITIAKEKRLLQMLGVRMKAEGQDRRMFTRFTRAIGGFLFQWHLLRRQLGLSSLNYMHEYLMADLAIQKPPISASTDITQAVSDAPFDTTALSPQTHQQRSSRSSKATQEASSWCGLKITQLTSSSVTVDWCLDESIFFPCSKTPPPLDTDAPVKIKPYEANLYFTAASHMGLETPVLVLSSLERSGTFHIDDLEPDTLYKITIAKDNPLNASSDQEDDGDDSRAEEKIQSPGKLSFYDNGAVIATPHRELLAPSGNETPTVDADRATMTPVALLPSTGTPATAPTTKAGLSPFPALSDLQDHTNRSPIASRNPQRLLLAEGETSARGPSIPSVGTELVIQEPLDIPKSEVVVFISTESEAPFQFDPEHMSPHLSVTPHSLTLHNNANKKWSTARASTRLVSGHHRWDVHIDRCVSKNIFIGVASREARLDNYVGCDKHGWAFLANKAVWHNKSKVKAYGELFKTGDTVTVVLDLDEGVLSYCLNGKPLGLALEGITGPLYPAFSLYNEDDQITVVQVRTSVCDSTSGAGSCAAEKVLQRLETLNSIFRCVSKSFPGDVTPAPEMSRELVVVNPDEPPSAAIDTSTVTEELGGELLQRWELWKAEIPVGSFLVGNDFVTICGSAEQCKALSKGKLRLWENVSLDSERAVVVGTGQHKVYLRVYATGALQGYTTDALEVLMAKGALVSIESDLDRYTDPTDQSSDLNLILPILPSPGDEHSRAGVYFNFEMSPAAMRDALLKLQSRWQASDDLVLVNFLVTSARVHGVRPGNLSVQHISQPSPASTVLEGLWVKYSEEDVTLRALLLIQMNDLVLPLLPLLCPFSNATEEQPFFPGPQAMQGTCSESASNHPTAALKQLRCLLFPQVKREFAERLATISTSALSTLVRPALSSVSSPLPRAAVTDAKANSASDGALSDRDAGVVPRSLLGGDRHSIDPADSAHSSWRLRTPQYPSLQSSAEPYLTGLSAVVPPSLSALKPDAMAPEPGTAESAATGLGLLGVTSSSAPYLDTEQMLVLEVSEESALGQYIYDLAAEKNAAQSIVLDDRWKFVCGIQCSYVGQMMSYFEQLACLNTNSGATDGASRYARFGKGALSAETLQLQQGGNSSAWENYLRSGAEGLSLCWANEGIPPKQRSVPFVVRPTSVPARTTGLPAGKEEAASPAASKLFRLLGIAQRFPDSVSEWCLFSVFVEEACDQVRCAAPLLLR
jgi:hypothetical protein